MANILATHFNNALRTPVAQTELSPVKRTEPTQPIYSTAPRGNLFDKVLSDGIVAQNKPVVNITPLVKTNGIIWKNDLKNLLHENNASIMGVILRTFNAKDTDSNGLIEGNEQHGTFKNAVERLDEIKGLGINTLHLLPIHPPGKRNAMGTAGSLYSAALFVEKNGDLAIDPILLNPNDKRPAKEQFKEFTDECHKRGIRVMLDLPSCASYDMFLSTPELMAFEKNGVAKTPQGWNDIRMFRLWDDETKRILNPALVDMHKNYVRSCIELGVDGIRADVARAKSTEFWDIIIPYSRNLDPNFAWLAESYTYEDASPQLNMPFDRPEDSLRVGFDSYYGQYHIFHEWSKASNLINYVIENIEMSKKLPKGKSVLGSFMTHDDISLMFHGGVPFCNLVSILQNTLPMLNRYIFDGFQSGDYYLYDYDGEEKPYSMTDSNSCTVHTGKPDIFNLSRKLGGHNPEIGEIFSKANKMREGQGDLFAKGSFIPLSKTGDLSDQVIAFARHYQGKTAIIIANKDVNKRSKCSVEIQGLKAGVKLVNIAPTYGDNSVFQTEKDNLKVDLGPARAHVFVIETPNIERYSSNVYKQNL